MVVEGKEEQGSTQVRKRAGEKLKMPVARPELSDSRVIAHVDMDCFYVQGFSVSLSTLLA